MENCMFCSSGTFDGDIVYANYGRPEDFDHIVEEYGEEFLTDKICMMRYGEVKQDIFINLHLLNQCFCRFSAATRC